MLSPHLTCEEAYLLATYVRSINPGTTLVLGPVPISGEDESFRGGFTIRAEKCPNRRGVEEIIVGLTKELVTWKDFLASVSVDDVDAVWFIDDRAEITLANVGSGQRFIEMERHR